MSFKLPNIDSFRLPENVKLKHEFLTYFEEATFALTCLEKQLLSQAIAFHGFTNVYSLEPRAIGFESMSELQEVVSTHKDFKRNNLKIAKLKIEEFEFTDKFDFIFSINVMEHVENIESVLEKVADLLVEGGVYYFICPNYSFPYEPHFNIPIVLNKKLTRKIYKSKISQLNASNPLDIWESLNWISVNKIKRLKIGELDLQFRSDVLHRYFIRLDEDLIFQSRKGYIFRVAAKFMKPLICGFPKSYQPIIECRAKRI